MDKHGHDIEVTPSDELELVSITMDHYGRLVADRMTLRRLHAAGVDNWEGYGDALVEDDDPWK